MTENQGCSIPFHCPCGCGSHGECFIYPMEDDAQPDDVRRSSLYALNPDGSYSEVTTEQIGFVV